MLMCWALVLAARLPIVERLFGGLDKVYKAHRRIGEAALYLIVLHPIFLALNPEFDFFRFFWIAQLPGEAGHYYLARMTGLIALAALVALTSLSLWISLPYHHWKQTHNFFGLVLVLVIFHGVVAQGEIMSYPVLGPGLPCGPGSGVCCYFYIRVLYRWFGPLHDYLVDHIRTLGDITEVHLRPRDPNRKMAFHPGQFLYVYFDSPDLRAEPHPFSISSAPQAGTSGYPSRRWATGQRASRPEAGSAGLCLGALRQVRRPHDGACGQGNRAAGRRDRDHALFEHGGE
jgi:predicted ferric reductase